MTDQPNIETPVAKANRKKMEGQDSILNELDRIYRLPFEEAAAELEIYKGGDLLAMKWLFKACIAEMLRDHGLLPSEPDPAA